MDGLNNLSVAFSICGTFNGSPVCVVFRNGEKSWFNIDRNMGMHGLNDLGVEFF